MWVVLHLNAADVMNPFPPSGYLSVHALTLWSKVSFLEAISFICGVVVKKSIRSPFPFVFISMFIVNLMRLPPALYG